METMMPEKPFFRNNANLKAANVKEYVSVEEMRRRAEEIYRCKHDILYFAEKYFHIISPGKGQHLIELYPKQKELIMDMVNNDRVIVLASRQIGKCVAYRTSVYARHVHTGDVQRFAIGDLHRMLARTASSNGLPKPPTSAKFTESASVEDYEVLGDMGFSRIVASHMTVRFRKYRVQFDDGRVLFCADEHILFKPGMEQVLVRDLRPGDRVESDCRSLAVSSVEDCMEDEEMYDLELEEGSGHRYFTNGVLSHNTTSYTIFALWYTLFHTDKKVLICANKEKTSLEFLARIRLAYELIPNFLKPGLVEWNKGRIAFSNGGAIKGSSTTPESARGESANCLIVDEMAFIQQNIMEEFWASVYPVVSSFKGTKVIAVSTPNGTGNLYYEIWNRAMLRIDKEGWYPVRIDWWDVPGRDEEWKKKQIASLNFNMSQWAQEFGNAFLGSSQTLLEAKIIDKFKEAAKHIPEPRVKLFDNLEIFKLNVFKEPVKGHTYVIGADVAEGVGGDFTTALVFDVGNLADMELVASFGSNTISTSEFAYLLPRIARMYNESLVCVECNSIGKAVTDAMVDVYDYDNFLTYGSKDPAKVGVYSHQAVKNFACLWLKDLLSAEEYSMKLNERQLIYEMEWFEKKKGGVKAGFAAAGTKHDDYMMSFVWAMLPLNPQILENYFSVEKMVDTRYGKTIPLRISAGFSGQQDHGGHGYDDDLLDQFTDMGEKLGKIVRGRAMDSEEGVGRGRAGDDEDAGGIGFFGDESDSIADDAWTGSSTW